jgi:hypothetical protein
MMKKIIAWCLTVEKIILGHAGIGIEECED